ncbi:hypothetical protein KQI52_14710 [bacterium]|nr:hypothetical protein [bacterium]
MGTRTAWRVPVTLSVLVVLAGCSTIATFNQRALENATDLKAYALILMDHAAEDADKYSEDIDYLELRLWQAYEYAAAIPKNEESAQQWEILKDPERDLLGGFLRDWKDGPLLPFLITEKKKQISAAFDEIIRLEKAKL